MARRFSILLDPGTRRNLIALMVISLTVLALEHLGWLTSFENTALDAFLLASRGTPSSHIFIIEITEQDYRDLFHSRSPLGASEVRHVLSLIEQGSPKVIGVDLDTSSSDYAEGIWPQAVWARDAIPVCDDRSRTEEYGPSNECLDPKGFLRLSYLGGKYKEEEEAGRILTAPPSGLSLFPLDRDGVVRRFRAAYPSDKSDPPASSTKGMVDSFSEAVLRTYHSTRSSVEESENQSRQGEKAHAEPVNVEEDLILNFTGDRYQFPRMSVKQLMQAAERPFWTTNSPLKNRIVLLGGTYRAARDVYFTPVGPRNGVELAAQAIESELSGGGFRPINHWIALLFDLIAGLGLIWLNKKLHGRFMLLVNALFIVVVSLLGSFFSFNAFAYWFNFTAVLVSIWIHVLWEREAHFRETQEELRQTLGELEERKREAASAQQEIGTLRLERDNLRERCEVFSLSQRVTAGVVSSTLQSGVSDEPGMPEKVVDKNLPEAEPSKSGD